MAKNMTQRVATTIRSREELESVLGEYAAAAIEQAKLGADLDAGLNRVRAAYEPRMAEVAETLEALWADLESWAALHRDEFAERRSLELLHGALGFRTGNPTLKTIKGVRWETVVDILAFKGLERYVRRCPEVAKDLLLADREQLGAEAMEELGLRVVQDERFFIEPRMEGVA